ncbi:hypothetical protein JHK82_049692 [Glycine max]|nr:hypothetical protein JHK82_049692 [Glycine max]
MHVYEHHFPFYVLFSVNNARMGVLINTLKTTSFECWKYWNWNTSYNLPLVLS